MNESTTQKLHLIGLVLCYPMVAVLGALVLSMTGGTVLVDALSMVAYYVVSVLAGALAFRSIRRLQETS
jgi:hypothetical protein